MLRVACFEFINERVMLMRSRTLGRVAVALAAAFLVAATTQIAQAFPSRGGNCSYCHSLQEGELEISQNDTVETVGTAELKTFVVEPGGGTQFKLTAVSKGAGRYNIVINRLDLLNEQVQYTPRLYTPDPDWSSSRQGNQYLGGQGRYYAASTTDVLQMYLFDLTLSPMVKLGFYTVEARMAGGNPEADPETGWNVLATFGLRVIPEPATASMLMLGFVPFLTRRFRR